jgi:hypothetical protein
MTRSEAEQLRGRLLNEHPDRATHSFILSERDGVWAVAKVALVPAGAGLAGTGPASPQPLRADASKGPGGLPNWIAGG